VDETKVCRAGHKQKNVYVVKSLECARAMKVVLTETNNADGTFSGRGTCR
jgi:hypothetical protein